MQSNFEQSLKEVLKHEGGWADHPKDPGGATMKGITIATFRKWVNKDATKDDLRKITDEQVSHIYRKVYWNAVRGDDLPSGLDYAVFDFGVNSGPSRAIKYLQAVLGVAQDGKIGPVTLQAAQNANVAEVINALCDRRLAFLKALKTWPTFSKGWGSRVAGVRSKALSMAGAGSKPSTGHLGPETELPDSPIVLEPMQEEPSRSLWWIGGFILIAFIAAIVFFFVPIR